MTRVLLNALTDLVLSLAIVGLMLLPILPHLIHH